MPAGTCGPGVCGVCPIRALRAGPPSPATGAHGPGARSPLVNAGPGRRAPAAAPQRSRVRLRKRRPSPEGALAPRALATRPGAEPRAGGHSPGKSAEAEEQKPTFNTMTPIFFPACVEDF